MRDSDCVTAGAAFDPVDVEHPGGNSGYGPLAGLRVVELGGIGPGPFCAMLLADMGADVIRLERPTAVGQEPNPVLHRGRRSIIVDLKQSQGVDVVLGLVAGADVFLEGFRPGVVERLGLGPDECLRRNRRLVYGRMTGFGQDGPLSKRAGHDINYIALSGALGVIGRAGEAPVPPSNLLGDFGGGGMLLGFGVACALLAARASGRGQVVDASMVDGSALLLAMAYGDLALDRWLDRRGSNLYDTGAPFYDVYRCADGEYMAVGALEPAFFVNLLDHLDLTGDPDFAVQRDRERWPAMRIRLTEIFATRTRAEWTEIFADVDACVTPVLSMREAPHHPHNIARGTFRTETEGVVGPAPAPRFSVTRTSSARPVPSPGQDTREVLLEAGWPAEQIEKLFESEVVR